MTRLVEFRLAMYRAGPQKGQESLWSFKLSGDTTQLFSQLCRLPRTQAHYYQEQGRWEVVPSRYVKQLLSAATANFDAAYRAARRKISEGK